MLRTLVDEELLAAIDVRVAESPEFTRSSVIRTVLREGLGMAPVARDEKRLQRSMDASAVVSERLEAVRAERGGVQTSADRTASLSAHDRSATSGLPSAAEARATKLERMTRGG